MNPTSLVLLLSSSKIAPVYAFSFNRPASVSSRRTLNLLAATGDEGAPTVDRQSDQSKYGRGIMHISADIKEGDVIAYQDGTWYVDGNEVGDGSGPIIRYMLVDTIQIVWTHDCEHGVINGFDITVTNSNDEPGGCDAAVEVQSKFVIGDEYIQCGPEQILARLPTVKGAEENVYVSVVRFLSNEEIVVA